MAEDLIELSDVDAQIFAHWQTTKSLSAREKAMLPRLSQASISKIASHLPLPKAVMVMAHGLGPEVILNQKALARRHAHAAAKRLRQLADDITECRGDWGNIQPFFDARKILTSAYAKRQWATAKFASELGQAAYRTVAAKQLNQLAQNLESEEFEGLDLVSLGYTWRTSDNGGMVFSDE